LSEGVLKLSRDGTRTISIACPRLATEVRASAQRRLSTLDGALTPCRGGVAERLSTHPRNVLRGAIEADLAYLGDAGARRHLAEHCGALCRKIRPNWSANLDNLPAIF
jgi:hypothetical protein